MTSSLAKATLIKRGKVKDIYQTSSGDLLFHFTDRVSAFDVPLPTPITNKGKILCLFAEYWFQTLGTRHHMVERVGLDRMVVKKLKMIPLECVVRGYLYGSLYERCKDGKVKLNVPMVLASKLPEPLFDPTTKSEEKDEPVTKQQAIQMGLCTPEEYRYLEETTVTIYLKMAQIAERAGFIIADLKLEFGKDSDGRILLADSIGPDEFRLWLKANYSPGVTQEAYDKQIVRDWLVENSYKRRLDDARKRGEPIPPPPTLPARLVAQVTSRYIEAYEKLSGRLLPA